MTDAEKWVAGRRYRFLAGSGHPVGEERPYDADGWNVCCSADVMLYYVRQGWAEDVTPEPAAPLCSPTGQDGPLCQCGAPSVVSNYGQVTVDVDGCGCEIALCGACWPKSSLGIFARHRALKHPEPKVPAPVLPRMPECACAQMSCEPCGVKLRFERGIYELTHKFDDKCNKLATPGVVSLSAPLQYSPAATMIGIWGAKGRK